MGGLICVDEDGVFDGLWQLRPCSFLLFLVFAFVTAKTLRG